MTCIPRHVVIFNGWLDVMKVVHGALVVVFTRNHEPGSYGVNILRLNAKE